MSKYLILFALIFMLWVGTGGDWTPIAPVVVLEDDVVISNTLPDWGVVCVATDVRGGPDESYPSIYSVGVGERVRIHDQSRPDGTWVSIKAAHWIPLEALCK